MIQKVFDSTLFFAFRFLSSPFCILLNSFPLSTFSAAPSSVDHFTTCLDTCAPLVTKKVKRPFAPWFNDEVKQAIANKNSLQTQLKANRYNAALQHRYKAEKNYVKALLPSSFFLSFFLLWHKLQLHKTTKNHIICTLKHYYYIFLLFIEF